MNLLINIALLTLGFLGTLAAFGGETWKKGDGPLRNRVTIRGWLSILFLSVALLVGVIKELRSTGEKSGLEAQVSSLHEQLQRQGALLAARRLEEIRDQEQQLGAFSQQMASIQAVYERFRSTTIAIHGRAKRKHAPPPYKLEFSYSGQDFRFDVCSRTFRVSAQRTFSDLACRNSALRSLVEGLPNSSYERSALGPSTIALMQFLAEISIAHRDALNGPVIVARSDAPEVSLATLLARAPGVCGASPEVVSSQLARTRVLRAIEKSAQELDWLFVYGDPIDRDPIDGAYSELHVQMFNLNKISRPGNDTDGEEPYRLGRFIDNLATGYQQLAKGVQEIKRSCKIRSEQLDAERKQIEAGTAIPATSARSVSGSIDGSQ